MKAMGLTISRAVRRMLAEGYLDRGPAPATAGRRACISPEGRALRQKIAARPAHKLV